jgi:hypothetical protein
MTITAENQAVIPIHKWRGIASSIIGATSIILTPLLFGIAMSGIQSSRAIATALLVFTSAMLCANVIGFALGLSGAKDRSSRKLYPLLGLILNAAIPVTFVGLALFTLMVPP